MVENLLKRGFVKAQNKMTPKEFIENRKKDFVNLKGNRTFEHALNDGLVNLVSTTRLPSGGTVQCLTDITELKKFGYFEFLPTVTRSVLLFNKFLIIALVPGLRFLWKIS